MSTDNTASDGRLEDFSIVKKGSIFPWLCRRLGFTPKERGTKFRAITVSLIAWLPLLVLAKLRAIGPGTAEGIPFEYDFSLHVRFLVALPLLILAEDLIDPALNRVVRRFSALELVPSSEANRFSQAISEAQRSRNAVLPEVYLLAIIAINSLSIVLERTGLRQSSGWFGADANALLQFNQLFWFILVAKPIFQFHLLRWMWRLVIWFRLLFRLSRLNLRMDGAHPDRRGGLGFLNLSQGHFAVLVFALSSVIASHLGVLLAFKSASLREFGLIIAIFVIANVGLFVLPLLLFSPLLLRSKRSAVMGYGRLALTYTRGFRQRWIEPEKVDETALLGTADIQSLADLANSYEVAAQMALFLPTRKLLGALILAAILPMLPLLAMMVPLTNILNAIVNLLL